MKTCSAALASSSLVLLACLTPSAHAAFTLFDKFDTYTLGPLAGQGPAGNVWTAQPGATVATQSGADKAADVNNNAIPNYRSLSPLGLQIENSLAASTVFWDFTMAASTTGNNWNFIVTDLAGPTDTGGTSEVQFNYDAAAVPAGTGATTTFRIRDAANFQFLSTNGTPTGRLVPTAGFLYNVWFQINNVNDTYQVFMQSPNEPSLLTRTQMFSDNGISTFGFRNTVVGNPQPNDLITVNMGNGGTTAVQFDDIYVDKAGFNSANPATVPEPSALTLVGVAGVLGLVRRRRA